MIEADPYSYYATTISLVPNTALNFVYNVVETASNTTPSWVTLANTIELTISTSDSSLPNVVTMEI